MSEETTTGKGNRKPKGEHQITVSLPIEVSADCADVAAKTGFTVSKVRDLVADKASAAANAAVVGKVDAIVKAHVLESLGIVTTPPAPVETQQTAPPAAPTWPGTT